MNARPLIDKIAIWEAANLATVKTVEKAIDTLNKAGIPALVTGGLAVIAHGYDVSTSCVDLIVPDFEVAHRHLLDQGYHASIHVPIGVIDPETTLRVDLLPGGRSLSPRCPVNFPMPTKLGYHCVTVAELVSTKLGSFLSNPVRRSKDRSAVIELIKNGLQRDLAGLDPAIQDLYQQTWDAVAAEPEGPPA